MGISEYFEEGWYRELKEYVESKDFISIGRKIAKEREINKIIPPKNSDLFLKVFRVVPYNKVKVVILGQDPYHGDGQFDGIAFSNSTLDSPQPSLANILEEVENDIYDGLNLDRINNYNLYDWARQGVLLTNAAHTVIAGNPGSHMHYWKNFTNHVVRSLIKKDNIVWLLWGRFAQGYKPLIIENKTHHIIETSHPSPLGVLKKAPISFADSKCFSKCNKYLEELGIEKIIW